MSTLTFESLDEELKSKIVNLERSIERKKVAHANKPASYQRLYTARQIASIEKRLHEAFAALAANQRAALHAAVEAIRKNYPNVVEAVGRRL